jgi:M6 family metalloprotease-like protein
MAMRTIRPLWRQALFALVILLLTGTGWPAWGVPLAWENMGFKQWPVPSTWNLLAIIVTYADSSSSPSQTAMDNEFFGSPSVAGYFKEVSDKRFTWKKAGTILLNLPKTDRYAYWRAKASSDNAARTLYFSNFVAKALASGQINLTAYDTNPNDNVVSQGELDIVILSPPDEPGFTQPWLDKVPQASSGRSWQGYALGMLHDTTMATINHELGHHCQTLTASGRLDWPRGMDLYGRWDRGDGYTECLNQGLTIMACSGENTHFGAWEKFRFGWCEPLTTDLRGGSVTLMAAALSTSINRPLMLTDFFHPNECFFVEYRTPTNMMGTVYDKAVPEGGLVIWHAKVDATDQHPLWLADATLDDRSQVNWWWCVNCYSLFFQSGASGGVCRAGGAHKHLDDVNANFRLPDDNPSVAGEQGWRWCNKCYGLYYQPNQAGSHCPAGSTHTAVGSGQYTCPVNGLPSYPLWNTVDAHWRRCAKCQGMFNASSSQTHAYCPAGGQHDGTGSPNYDFQMRMQRYAVGTRGASDLTYASNSPWKGGSVTPPLFWYDGTRTEARIYVQPFEPGALTVTIEWGNVADAWVDFSWPGLPGQQELATFDMPFNTWGEGLNAVAPLGTLHIKSGHTAEKYRVTRPMTLSAYGGPVTIGR